MGACARSGLVRTRWSLAEERKMRKRLAALWLVLMLPLGSLATPGTLIDWQAYSPEAFARAKADNRLILLELEAVWCHWCHVMDEKTWNDPQVAATMRKHFVAVRVDHDARPDLAERYRDYGWPALIILDANGKEIVKRAGYIAPEPMLRLLAAVINDPSPERTERAEPSSWALSPLLAEATARELESRFVATHDFALGGLIGDQKMVDRDATEYALQQRNNPVALAIARSNLAAGRQLADPVWGGIYQYSTGGNWAHPHFEKLGFIQADYLRMFALGFAALQDPRDREAIHLTHRYLRRFLQAPDGSFYTSQDADLKPGEHAGDYFAMTDRQRQKQGIPKVDRSIYARENGLIASALAEAYMATGEPALLHDAERSASRMLATRRLQGGGFSHSASDSGGPYLADNLAMLRALLSLHSATGERHWLREASATAGFIAKRFARINEPGFVGAVSSGPLPAVASLDENLALARAANLLFHYSGERQHRELAESAMRYLVTPELALSRISDPGILLAAHELASDPVHLTVVGQRDDPAARKLFTSAMRWPASYKRIEWWDRREGPLTNADVNYPALSRAAAYVCTEGRCSRPVFDPAELKTLTNELEQPSRQALESKP